MGKSGFAKGSYFDRDAVIKAVGRANAKVSARQGALVRTIMHRSMRKHKGHAAPGQPPYSHQGNLAKIEFAFDFQTQTTVVGPAKLGDGTAPEVLDKGGYVNVRGVFSRKGVFIPLYLMKPATRQKAIASGKTVMQRRKVEARPFSQPALQKAIPLLAKEWKGAVTK